MTAESEAAVPAPAAAKEPLAAREIPARAISVSYTHLTLPTTPYV